MLLDREFDSMKKKNKEISFKLPTLLAVISKEEGKERLDSDRYIVIFVPIEKISIYKRKKDEKS